MTAQRRRRWVAMLSLAALVLAGCNEDRDRPEPPLAFADVQPILESNCLECHSGPQAAAGYRVDDYFTTIRCIPDPEGQPATLPPDQTAPILAVLGEPSHADLLDAEETSTLTTWVTEGAFPDDSGTHPGQWTDPRAPDWHGSYLRETDWQPIIDSERVDACGRCHAGSPAPVTEVTIYPPGATNCTDCHDLPGGVMACGTCHGNGLRAYPPRDQCYFPGPPEGFAHGPHVQPSANNPSGLDCQACHFGEDYQMLGDGHANGEVNVVFQPAWGADASYDFETRVCATTCHVRGGTTPTVAWDETDLEIDCNSCHQTPPVGHAKIACNTCHLGINPAGTRLTIEAPHINGRVDAFP
ncbi:MAG: CxxxxCH/CxxCH domain-containing protein [Polyangiales bacterium]